MRISSIPPTRPVTRSLGGWMSFERTWEIHRRYSLLLRMPGGIRCTASVVERVLSSFDFKVSKKGKKCSIAGTSVLVRYESDGNCFGSIPYRTSTKVRVVRINFGPRRRVTSNTHYCHSECQKGQKWINSIWIKVAPIILFRWYECNYWFTVAPILVDYVNYESNWSISIPYI